MNWLNNLRLSLRITLSFGAAAVILLCEALFVTDKMEQLNDGGALANEFWLMTYILIAVILGILKSSGSMAIYAKKKRLSDRSRSSFW